MATPVQNLKNRNASETSKLLKGVATRNNVINITGDKFVRDILNKKFIRSGELLKSRNLQLDRIKQLNDEYSKATENVLNDKTLDFLIAHSQINVPTLTSIFAGFELARSSRADKLNEERQLEVDRINSLSKSQQEDFNRSSNIENIELKLSEDVRSRALGETQDAFKASSTAIQGDITDQANAERQSTINNRIVSEGALNRQSIEQRNRDSIEGRNDTSNAATGLLQGSEFDLQLTNQLVAAPTNETIIDNTVDQSQQVSTNDNLIIDDPDTVPVDNDSENFTIDTGNVSNVPDQREDVITDSALPLNALRQFEVDRVSEFRAFGDGDPLGTPEPLSVNPDNITDNDINEVLNETRFNDSSLSELKLVSANTSTDSTSKLNDDVITELDRISVAKGGFAISPSLIENLFIDNDIDPETGTIRELNDIFNNEVGN